MLIYEVNLEVDPEIDFKFAGWLTEHIQEMLKLKGFKAAQWFFRQPEDEGVATAKVLWTIHYLVESRASLDDYFKQHAEIMRQQALDRFGDKFIISRRVLNLLSVAGFPPLEPQAS